MARASGLHSVIRVAEPVPMPEPQPLRYSVVIPVHNEEQDVEELARRVAENLEEAYEIIFVDDGSTDLTWQVLERTHDADRVRIIRFRRNFGKAAALMAGFAASRGEIVFTMDGDLQDDPNEMRRFLDKLAEGYDLVSGYKKRRLDPLTKVIASRIFNFAVRKLTKVDLHDMNCGFKCYRGELARSIRIYGELHRFIPALAAYEGYRIGEIEVQHHARRHGRSKYGISRLFKGLIDLITVLLTTQYRARPAHGFGWAALGLLAGAFGFAVLSLVSARVLVDLGPVFLLLSTALWPVAALLAIAGVVALSAGWVAEVVVFDRYNAEPTSQYVIGERRD